MVVFKHLVILLLAFLALGITFFLATKFFPEKRIEIPYFADRDFYKAATSTAALTCAIDLVAAQDPNKVEKEGGSCNKAIFIQEEFGAYLPELTGYFALETEGKCLAYYVDGKKERAEEWDKACAEVGGECKLCGFDNEEDCKRAGCVWERQCMEPRGLRVVCEKAYIPKLGKERYQGRRIGEVYCYRKGAKENHRLYECSNFFFKDKVWVNCTKREEYPWWECKVIGFELPQRFIHLDFWSCITLPPYGIAGIFDLISYQTVGKFLVCPLIRSGWGEDIPLIGGVIRKLKGVIISLAETNAKVLINLINEPKFSVYYETFPPEVVGRWYEADRVAIATGIFFQNLIFNVLTGAADILKLVKGGVTKPAKEAMERTILTTNKQIGKQGIRKMLEGLPEEGVEALLKKYGKKNVGELVEFMFKHQKETQEVLEDIVSYLAEKSPVLKKAKMIEFINKYGTPKLLRKYIVSVFASTVAKADVEEVVLKSFREHGAAFFKENGFENLAKILKAIREGKGRQGVPDLVKRLGGKKFFQEWEGKAVFSVIMLREKGIEITEEGFEKLLRDTMPEIMGVEKDLLEQTFSQTVGRKGVKKFWKDAVEEFNEITHDNIREFIKSLPIKEKIEKLFKSFGNRDIHLQIKTLAEYHNRLVKEDKFNRVLSFLSKENPYFEGDFRSIAKKFAKVFNENLEFFVLYGGLGKEILKKVKKVGRINLKDWQKGLFKKWFYLIKNNAPELAKAKIKYIGRSFLPLNKYQQAAFVVYLLFAWDDLFRSGSAEKFGTCGSNSLCLHAAPVFYSFRNNNLNYSLEKRKDVLTVLKLPTVGFAGLANGTPIYNRLYLVSPCKTDLHVYKGFEVKCKNFISSETFFYEIYLSKLIDVKSRKIKTDLYVTLFEVGKCEGGFLNCVETFSAFNKPLYQMKFNLRECVNFPSLEKCVENLLSEKLGEEKGESYILDKLIEGKNTFVCISENGYKMKITKGGVLYKCDDIRNDFLSSPVLVMAKNEDWGSFVKRCRKEGYTKMAACIEVLVNEKLEAWASQYLEGEFKDVFFFLPKVHNTNLKLNIITNDVEPISACEMEKGLWGFGWWYEGTPRTAVIVEIDRNSMKRYYEAKDFLQQSFTHNYCAMNYAKEEDRLVAECEATVITLEIVGSILAAIPSGGASLPALLAVDVVGAAGETFCAYFGLERDYWPANQFD